MTATKKSKIPPSTRWTSLDPWDFSGLKERLEGLIAKLDTSVLVRHAEQMLGQKVTMSRPFSAGQYWVCFEMIAEDDSLVIARVRLPRHPNLPAAYSDEDERYSIDCEAATMAFVRQNLPGVKIPRLYAYEGAGSELASSVGAAYMLLEGFYGNTLQDVEFDLCNLPVATQEHIIAQWTRTQAEIATLAFPSIGSISSVSAQGEPVIGRLAAAAVEGLKNQGPYPTAAAYFGAVADAAISRLCVADDGGPNAPVLWAALGALVFRDIVQHTTVYAGGEEEEEDEQGGSFPLSHMDLGTQNILVDESFNIVAVIDWEFAQTAPWPVNHYPMPFPLHESDGWIQDILRDPRHIAHGNVARQEAARRLYVRKFRDAEAELGRAGRGLGGSFANVLDGAPSRIHACFASLGDLPEADESLVREMVRLAFGFDAGRTEEYLREMEGRARQAIGNGGGVV